MRKAIFAALVILFIVAIVPAQDNKKNADRQNPIQGQWVNQKNDILKFTVDKKVYLNGQKFGQYRFEGSSDEMIVVVDIGNDSAKREYYKLERDKQNRLMLISMDSEKKSKEKTFNKILPRVE